MKMKEEDEEEMRRKAIFMNHQQIPKKSERKKQSFKPIKKLTSQFALGNLWLYILILLTKKSKTLEALKKGLYSDFYMSPSDFMLLLTLKKMQEEGFIDKQSNKYVLRDGGIAFLKDASKYMDALAVIIKHYLKEK